MGVGSGGHRPVVPGELTRGPTVAPRAQRRPRGYSQSSNRTTLTEAKITTQFRTHQKAKLILQESTPRQICFRVDRHVIKPGQNTPLVLYEEGSESEMKNQSTVTIEYRASSRLKEPGQ